MKCTWIAIALACVLSSPLFAQEPMPCVDVVLIVDETCSMQPQEAYYNWLATTVAALQSDYQAAGVGNSPGYPNRYILVGFGSSIHGAGPWAHFHGGWMDAPSMVTNINTTLAACGCNGDGYQAIENALTQLTFRRGAFRAIILLTKEDRYVLDPVTRQDILKMLGGKANAARSQEATLNGVVNAFFETGKPDQDLADVLGVNWDGTAYIPAGGDKYYVVPGGYFDFGDGNTKMDYVELCWLDRGSAWNIWQIWWNGPALTDALTDVKVGELKPVVETNGAEPHATWFRGLANCQYDGGQLCWFWFEYREAGSLSWKRSVEWFPTFTGDWFTDEIRDLKPDTDYLIRAWVRNSVMSAVGAAWTVRTLPAGTPDPAPRKNGWNNG